MSYTQPDPLAQSLAAQSHGHIAAFRDVAALYTYVSNQPTTSIDPTGLCQSGKCQDCPSGHWTTNESSFDVNAGLFGGTASTTTAKCAGSPTTCTYYSFCWKVGLGVGFSASVAPGFGGGAGCNCGEDLAGSSTALDVGTGKLVLGAGYNYTPGTKCNMHSGSGGAGLGTPSLFAKNCKTTLVNCD